jgi:hypothetical protein
MACRGELHLVLTRPPSLVSLNRRLAMGRPYQSRAQVDNGGLFSTREVPKGLGDEHRRKVWRYFVTGATDYIRGQNHLALGDTNRCAASTAWASDEVRRLPAYF